MLERMGRLVCLKGSTKQCLWEPHLHHKASNHRIKSKLMHHFHNSTPPHVNSLICGMSNVIHIVTANYCSDLPC